MSFKRAMESRTLDHCYGERDRKQLENLRRRGLANSSISWNRSNDSERTVAKIGICSASD